MARKAQLVSTRFTPYETRNKQRNYKEDDRRHCDDKFGFKFGSKVTDSITTNKKLVLRDSTLVIMLFLQQFRPLESLDIQPKALKHYIYNYAQLSRMCKAFCAKYELNVKQTKFRLYLTHHFECDDKNNLFIAVYNEHSTCHVSNELNLLARPCKCTACNTEIVKTSELQLNILLTRLRDFGGLCPISP